MTRGDVRELALHLVYGREFTGEEPDQAVSARLEKNYREKLSEDCPLYADRPSRGQLAYLDCVVTGVANREAELSELIRKYAIGWDLSRISRLARAAMKIAIFEAQYVESVPVNVAISEAVRLTKLYDGEETAAFVNGILGSFARSLPAEETV